MFQILSRKRVSTKPMHVFVRAAVLEALDTRQFFDATLTPTADTFVRDGSFATTVYGNYPAIQAKQGAAGVQRQILLKFDVSGVAGTISNAKLRLYGKRSATSDATFAVAAKDVADNSWTEAATTWNNKPAVGSSLGTATVLNTASGWSEIDVTPYIQQAKAAGQTAVSIAVVGTANTTDYFEMSAREGVNAPQLFLTTQAAPAAPTGLAASSVQSASVTIGWTDNASNETGYKIERKIGAGAWTLLTTAALAANTVSYTDSSVQPGVSYSYRIYATGTANSGYSNEIAVTTPAASQVQTLAPSGDTYARGGTNASTNYGTATELQAKLIAGDLLRETYITFAIPAGTTSVSNVKLRVYGHRSSTVDGASLAFAVKPVATTTWNESTLTYNNKPAIGATTLGTIAVTGTTNAWYEVDLTSYMQQELTAGHNVVSVAIVGTVNNSDAYLGIVSKEAAGTNGPQLVVTAQGATGQAPAAPTGVTATGMSPKTVRVTWNDVATTETGYQVQYRVQGGTGAYTTVSLPAGSTTTDITNLTPGTAYEFRVSALGTPNSAAVLAADGTTGSGTFITPVISFSSPTKEGTAIALSISSSTSGVSGYAWTISSGTLTGANTATPSFVPADDGSYNVAVTMTYTNGDTATTSSVISVANVAPTLGISGQPTADINQTYSIGVAHTDPGADTVQSWTINWGDGTAAQTFTSSDPTPTHQYIQAGNYAVTGSATDEDGTYTVNTPSYVTVKSGAVTPITVLEAERKVQGSAGGGEDVDEVIGFDPPEWNRHPQLEAGVQNTTGSAGGAIGVDGVTESSFGGSADRGLFMSANSGKLGAGLANFAVRFLANVSCKARLESIFQLNRGLPANDVNSFISLKDNTAGRYVSSETHINEPNQYMVRVTDFKMIAGHQYVFIAHVDSLTVDDGSGANGSGDIGFQFQAFPGLTDASVRGDANADDVVDQTDIDVENGPSAIDLNGDQTIDVADQTYLVQTILNTRLGDLNLDGKVDSVDSAVLSNHLGSAGTYITGDINGDGLVTSADSSILSANLGYGA